MLSVIYAERHLGWESFRLSIIYAESHLCYVSFICFGFRKKPFMQSVIMPNAIMLSVAALAKEREYFKIKFLNFFLSLMDKTTKMV